MAHNRTDLANIWKIFKIIAICGDRCEKNLKSAHESAALLHFLMASL